MSAKSDLLQRLQYLSDAAANSALIDVGVGQSSHNGIAQLLRRGLGIVAFNIIEDYVKQRMAEALVNISGSGIAFSNLTASLQKSSTEGVLKALQFQATLQKKNASFDVKAFIQAEAYNIYSTGQPNFSLSKYSFGYSTSNINSDEVAEALKSFGISDGWAKLLGISRNINGGIPDLRLSFENASMRRNSCAHDVNFNYAHSWLSNIRSEIMAIAASLDIAINAKCRQVNRHPSQPLNHRDIQSELRYLFLLQQPTNIWKQKRKIIGPTVKSWTDLSAAITHIVPTLSQRKEYLILLDSSSRILDWFT
jgi:hypothetical protein